MMAAGGVASRSWMVSRILVTASASVTSRILLSVADTVPLDQACPNETVDHRGDVGGHAVDLLCQRHRGRRLAGAEGTNGVHLHR